MNRIHYFLELAKSDKPLTPDDKDELQQLLKFLRDKYDEGHPMISDTEYDVLYEFAIYEGEIRSASESNDYGKRVQHPIDILRGTLDKVYYLSDDEPRTNKSRKSLSEWLRPVAEILRQHNIDVYKEEVIVTAKYDGMSCCQYVDSKGNCLWLTRGDTESNEGVDIGHVMNGMNVPRIPNTATQFELLIPNDMLDELNQRYSTEYKNTRALTAGIIRTKEIDYRAQFITPIPLKIYQDGKLQIHREQITKYPSIKCTIKDIDKIRAFADQNHHVFGKYRTDGIVITFLNPEVQRILGRKDNINQFEVAYKFTEESSYSTVQDIHFQVSDMGVITPVVIIRPVVMKGNTITKISLHNKLRFDEMNLHYNDTIKVLYDIIPYCTHDDYTKKMNAMNDNPAILFPDRCPECNSELDTMQTIVCCTNRKCPVVKIGRLINYLEQLKCKGIGPETVHRLYELGVINDIPSLYRIGSTKQMRIIQNAHGFGELKLKMILNWIRQISHLKDYEFFAALGFKGLNTQFFKILFNEYHMDNFLNDIANKNWSDMQHRVALMKGIGDKKAALMLKGLKEDRQLIERCLKVVKLFSTYNQYSDETPSVVFTGFRSKELEDLFEQHGFAVKDNVTKSTTVVVTKTSDAETGSTKKAMKHGIPIITADNVSEYLSDK